MITSQKRPSIYLFTDGKLAPPPISRTHSFDYLNARVVPYQGHVVTLPSAVKQDRLLYVMPITHPATQMSTQSMALIAGFNVPEKKAVQVVNYSTRPPERFAVAYDPLALSEFGLPRA